MGFYFLFEVFLHNQIQPIICLIALTKFNDLNYDVAIQLEIF